MSTFIRIFTGHMRCVQAHCQSDGTTATLPPAKLLVEIVFIFNEVGRDKYLDHSIIHRILALASHGICHMIPALTKFFPRTNNSIPGALPQQGHHPMRPIPIYQANITTTRLTAPTTPPI